MHYANDRAAKVGDLVRGRGYSLKYEFTGVLVSAQPGSSACNCQVATVSPRSTVLFGGYPGENASNLESARYTVGGNTPSYVFANIEYGQLDAFVAIDPATGEVLLPEGVVADASGTP